MKKSKSRVCLLRIMSGIIYVNNFEIRSNQRQAIQTRIFGHPIYSQNVVMCVRKKTSPKESIRERCVNGNEKIFFSHTQTIDNEWAKDSRKAMNFNALFVLIFYFRKCLNLPETIDFIFFVSRAFNYMFYFSADKAFFVRGVQNSRILACNYRLENFLLSLFSSFTLLIIYFYAINLFSMSLTDFARSDVVLKQKKNRKRFFTCFVALSKKIYSDLKNN